MMHKIYYSTFKKSEQDQDAECFEVLKVNDEVKVNLVETDKYSILKYQLF